MSRLERLAERLELRLLVSEPVNVLYLTGLASSNAALLVDPDGPVGSERPGDQRSELNRSR